MGVTWGLETWEEAGGASLDSMGLGEGEESKGTGGRVILEAKWNIHRRGCQGGGRAGSWQAGKPRRF